MKVRPVSAGRPATSMAARHRAAARRGNARRAAAHARAPRSVGLPQLRHEVLVAVSGSAEATWPPWQSGSGGYQLERH
jgi:hypothetical protein